MKQVVLASVIALSLAWGGPGMAQSADAKHLVEVAAKLKSQGAFDLAAEQYDAAYKAAPSADILRPLLECVQQLGQSVRTVEITKRLLEKHAKEMKRGEVDQLKAGMSKAYANVAQLEVRIAEPGATISLDAKPIGTSPLPSGLIDVDAGKHKVSARKEGLEPFETEVAVVAKQNAIVDVVLERIAVSGAVSIKERTGLPVSVLVDGVEKGPAPWSGELPLGLHQVVLHSPTRQSETKSFEVVKRAPLELALDARATTGRLEINLADNAGVVYIDKKFVAVGHFTGELPAGSHALLVRRDGFLPLEQTISLTAGETVPVQVSLVAEKPTPSIEETEEPRARGTYGALLFIGVLQANALGSQVDSRCADIGSDCSSSSPKGGGAVVEFGHSWRTLALEFMFGGAGDGSVGRAADAKGDRHAYDLARAGGMAAVRMRATVWTPAFRASVAGGPGVAVRYALVGSDGADYISPAGVLDGSLGLRMNKGSSFVVGIMYWLESAGGSSPTVQRAESKTAFAAASGLQHMLYPYLGFEFGP